MDDMYIQKHYNDENDGRDGVSNHQPHDCLLNRLFRHRSKKTSKLRVIGLCEGNSPVTGEFPAQRASNAENISIWWRHHGRSPYPSYSVYIFGANDQGPAQIWMVPTCFSCLQFNMYEHIRGTTRVGLAFILTMENKWGCHSIKRCKKSYLYIMYILYGYLMILPLNVSAKCKKRWLDVICGNMLKCKIDTFSILAYELPNLIYPLFPEFSWIPSLHHQLMILCRPETIIRY